MGTTTFNGTPIYKLVENLPRINEVTNNENIEIFKKYGTRNSDDPRHTCVLCNKKVDLEHSISNRGHKLICIGCVYNYFEGDYRAANVWQEVY